MEIFGIGITILSIVIAYLAWSNGKWMKTMIVKIDEHLTKMDEHLTKIDDHLIKIDEHLIKMDEHLTKMDEYIVKMDERAEKRHMEVIELLKKGFGEIIGEVKKN